MLKRKTLFIVGAGASKEFNLPIGSELIQMIQTRLTLYREDRQVLENNRDFLQDLIRYAVLHGRERGHYLALAEVIKNGLYHAKSIDNFIRTHNTNQDLVFVCKLAISDVIAQCERNSLLLPDGSFKPSFGVPRLTTWLEVLTKNLFAELDLDELPAALSNLRFVCFNYDRCVEVFLRRAIQNYFLVDRLQAQSLVDRVKIIHPYGSLGKIWNEVGAVEFAADIGNFDVLNSATKIRTFHEGVADASIANEISESMTWTGTIVFLGFGYLQQNMEIIKPPANSLSNSVKPVFMTVYGMSGENSEMVIGSINSLMHNGQFSVASVRAPNVSRTCSQLLEAHSAELFGL